MFKNIEDILTTGAADYSFFDWNVMTLEEIVKIFTINSSKQIYSKLSIFHNGVVGDVIDGKLSTLGI